MRMVQHVRTSACHLQAARITLACRHGHGSNSRRSRLRQRRKNSIRFPRFSNSACSHGTGRSSDDHEPFTGHPLETTSQGRVLIVEGHITVRLGPGGLPAS